MANIIEYSLKFNKTFDEEPFNEVDGLILSQLCYLNLDGYEDKIATGNFTINELDKDRSKTLLNIRVPKQNSKLLSSLAENPRFKDIKIIKYINLKKAEKQIQFSSTIYSWGDEGCIAFRGTDSTLIGWKEDFNAMFMDVIPSEKKSVSFIEENIDILPKNFYICGHSKGGHIAAYAAINVKKEIQDRIIIVFNNDGPGVKKEVLESKKYLRIKDRIMYLLPQQSVFGLILFNNNDYLVVKSDGIWIQQHDPFNWKVTNNCLVYLDEIARYSSINSDALNRWLDESDPDKRILLVETLYNIMTLANVEKVGDVPKGILKNYDSVIKALKEFDKEDLNKIFGLIDEFKSIKKEIELANPVTNEHRSDKEIKKFIKKVTKPIIKIIDKLPIEEVLETVNNNIIVIKTKNAATKVGKSVVNTAKYVTSKANEKTKELGEFVTKELENAKKHNDEILDNDENIIDSTPVIEETTNDIKKKKDQESVKKFKEKYFEFYDDIKHYTKGEEDW